MFKTLITRIRQVEPTLQHEGFVFTFSFLYIIVNVLYFFVGAAPEWNLAAGSPRFIRVIRGAARGSGSVLNINSAFIILVASKIFLSILRRTPLNMFVPFDKAMPHFHAMVGSTIAIAAFVHTLCHLINYGVNEIATTGIHGHISLAVTGTVLFMCIGLIRYTSLKSVKSAISYELWFVCHISGMIMYFFMLVLHGSHHGKFSSYKFIVGPLALYIIDIFLRRLRSRPRAVLIPGYTATTVGPRIVKLNMEKDDTFQYLAGQYCYINVPPVSYWEWHPFSIASSPHEDRVTFYIKTVGDWTKKLYSLCSKDTTTEPFPRNIPVFMRGPFGAPAQHVGQYEHVILISGGVGGTPFTSITKYAHNYIMNHTSMARRYVRSPHTAYLFNYGAHNALETEKIPKGIRGARFTRRRREEHVSYGEEDITKRESRTDAPPWAKEWDEVQSRGLDATFLSKAKGAANNTFTAMSRTLKNALFIPDSDNSLGDPNEPIPERFPRSVSDFSQVHDREFETDPAVLQEKAQEWENELLQGNDAPSQYLSALGRDINGPYPYKGVDAEDSSEISLLFQNAVIWKDKALVLLHSVTLNWILLWMMLIRFAVVGIGRITGRFALNNQGLSLYSNSGLNVIDLALSIVLLIPVVLTIVIEIASYGLMKFFHQDFGNVFDFVLLTPLAIICVVLHSLGLSGIGATSHHVSKVVVFGVWPVLSIFLLWRIIRTIGSRVALARFFRSRVGRTKSLDFLFINPTHVDDEWIIDELMPIASSGPVRVHRFLTKEEEDKSKSNTKMKHFIEPPIKTTYGKPDWNKVFLNVVERSRSGTVIGVFFCGPSKMQRFVQEGIMNAMQKSIMNSIARGYDPSNDRGREQLSPEDEAYYGCSVRIALRTEKFS